MHKIRRLVYRLGFRPKRDNLFHSPSLALTYGWKDRGMLLSQQKLSWERPVTKQHWPGEDHPRTILDAVVANRSYRSQPKQVYYITTNQILALVKMDEEGRDYDKWVEMLIEHGWTVIDMEKI